MPPSVTLYIVYDNNPSAKPFHAEWGLSIFVWGLKETILFDTGGGGNILGANMRHLGISRDGIDIVVLSHMHRDHYGGMEAVLRKGQRIYLPSNASETLTRRIRTRGATAEKCRKPVQVQPHVHTTGTFGGVVKEQGLLVYTPAGRLLLTGCAHPGIEMMTKTLADSGRRPDIVVGGFHMKGLPEEKIREIAESIRSMGVRQIGPCHCSGDAARSIFKEVFGPGYIEAHVGAKITLKKG
jgi:7,8-dihydropterin-6-yl-methyl-4-(beta-D-ribofuranosyl)aminobenzene 5'-phosphate synthase